MAKSLLSLEGISRTFGEGEAETKALIDATFSVNQGEFVSIMGASGSGKSTLLHLLGLLDRPTGGRYTFAGQDTSTLDDLQLATIRNENMGFVFQSFFLLPRASVLENVMLPLHYSNKGQSEWKDMALRALEQVGLMHRLDHEPSQLSGGEKQRVAIARALVNEPDIIFADEPTGNLDTTSGQMVMNMIRDLHEKGHTIILITHEMTAALFGERLLQLSDGKIIKDSPILNRSEEFAK